METPNTMPPSWCAARVAEARRWRDATPQSTPGWHHVHELLNQLDHPPLPTTLDPAAPYRAPARGEAATARAELRQLAEAATAGPWHPGLAPDSCEVVIDSDDAEICYTTNSREALENQAYIAAANPAAVLALLDALEAAEAEATGLRARLGAANEMLEDADHWMTVPTGSNSDRHIVSELSKRINGYLKQRNDEPAPTQAPAAASGVGVRESRCTGCEEWPANCCCAQRA